MEVANPETDYIRIHDYHHMVVPMFLRNKRHRAKLGFFLHSPFPHQRSIEHFFRMLGLDYKSKRGQIGLYYSGRTVYIKILPIGIHLEKGCSPSLSGAIRINPRDISSVAEAMRSAVSMDDSSRQLRHEKNYSYVQSHDVAYWARSSM
ncbi:hypothetical protein ACET3Z_030647 [Daucus carota]